MRSRCSFLCFLILLLFVHMVLAQETLLDIPDKYHYEFTGEKYMKPCNNNHCELELQVLKQADIHDYSLTLEAMKYTNQWIYTDFEKQVAHIETFQQEHTTFANGSEIISWKPLNDLDNVMDSLNDGEYITLKYEFDIQEKTDIVPVLYTDTKENRFEELAIFFPQDPNVQWPVYFPFDLPTGITDPPTNIPNYAYQAAGQWDTDSVNLINWSNSSVDGLLINGSYAHIHVGNNTWIGEKNTWVPSSDSFVNDSAAFMFLGKNLNCQGSSCYVMHMQANTPSVNIIYMNNNSFSVYMRDSGATENTFYFKPYPAQYDIWSLYTWSFNDIGNVVEVKMYVNSTLWGAENVTTNANTLFDGIANCDTGSGACEFLGLQNFDGFTLNGYFDEIRLYAVMQNASTIAQMSATYFTTVQHNISFTDVFLGVTTNQYVNRTLQINFTNTTSANFSVNDSSAQIMSVNASSLTLLLDASSIFSKNITISGTAGNSFAQQWINFTVLLVQNASSNQTQNGTTTNVNVSIPLDHAVNMFVIFVMIAIAMVVSGFGLIQKVPWIYIVGGLIGVAACVALAAAGLGIMQSMFATVLGIAFLFVFVLGILDVM